MALNVVSSDRLSTNVKTSNLATGLSDKVGQSKNIIINGAMTINQRGHSGTITDGGYSLDRYRLNITSAGAWSITQADLGTAGPTGFRNSLKLDCDTANGSLSAGSLLQLHQKIEAQDLQQLAYGSSGAKSVTISFWIKSNKTGTFPLELYCSDPSTNRQYIKLYTISSADTWEKKTLTFAGDTGGQINNDNGTGMTVNWYLAAGTDWTSGSNDPQWVNNDTTERAAGLTVNLADSTSNYVEITGLQLEVGDTATEFEHRSYGDELARCQRYYYVLADGSSLADQSFGNGIGWSSSQIEMTAAWPVVMRTAPSLVHSTGTNYYQWRNGSNDKYTNSLLISSATTRHAIIYKNSMSGITVGMAFRVQLGDSSAYVHLNAEL